jgi:hypothetical protein
MQVEYKTSRDLDITRILCDRCARCIWTVEGKLTDSHLTDRSGAMCLCEDCAKACVIEPSVVTGEIPF